MSKTKRTPADELIAAASVGARTPQPSAAGLDALRTLCTHNDASGRSGPGRVSAEAAIVMLRTHYGWQGAGRTALDSLCRSAFGRRSYGTP